MNILRRDRPRDMPSWLLGALIGAVIAVIVISMVLGFTVEKAYIVVGGLTFGRFIERYTILRTPDKPAKQPSKTDATTMREACDRVLLWAVDQCMLTRYERRYLGWYRGVHGWAGLLPPPRPPQYRKGDEAYE